MGSTRVARLAGIEHATSRNDEKKDSTLKNVTQSPGVTRNSKLDKSRVSASAATMPMATPANVATIP